MTNDDSSLLRGPEFERRVVQAINRLAEIGFARDIRIQDFVKDRDGNTRKVDVSFVLCTWAVEILISVECKSRNRTLSLDEVDQIKVLKRELPERNIFWLVTEGSVGSSVSKALEAVGVSIYRIDALENIINEMCELYEASGLQRLREMTIQLSTLNPSAYGRASAGLKKGEMRLIEKLKEVQQMLEGFSSYWQNPYSR